MRTSAMLLLCMCAVGALTLASAQTEDLHSGVTSYVPAFTDPCHPTYSSYHTGLSSLQGVWEGTCTQSNYPLNSSLGFETPCGCGKPYTYPYTIAFNGTDSGVNISGGVILPLGAVSIEGSTLVDHGARIFKLNFAGSPALVHVTVTCKKGVPTYQEASLHLLQTPVDPTTFPVVQRRDAAKPWCNSKLTEHNEHAAGSFNIICTCTRVRDIGAGWPGP